MVAEANPRPTKTLTLHNRDALEWGTIGNAKALGMDDRIGSLTPGKQADIILTRTDDLNTAPVHDPVQTLVYMATPFNIDTVFIAGKIKKRGGKMVYPEAALREKLSQLEASGRRILGQAGVSKAAAG
jgi:cytosine/adenosine deaminase-related metal-dependent hydrolase